MCFWIASRSSCMRRSISAWSAGVSWFFSIASCSAWRACSKRARGALGGALLERQRQLPHPRLRLIHRVRVAAARQQGGDGAQVQHDAEGVVERLRRVGQRVDRQAGVAAGVRRQAELAADGDQGAGDRVAGTAAPAG